MGRCGWVWVAAWLSACLEPEAFLFPAESIADARTVLWLLPGEAPIVEDLGPELRRPLQLRSSEVRARAMLYRCSPDELRVEAMFAQHGCLSPTQRQLVSAPGEPKLQKAPDLSPLPECGPCELWPTTVRHELQVPSDALSIEVGVALPDGQILISVESMDRSELARVDPRTGTIVTVEPSDGPSQAAFGPYFIDETGLYGMRAKSIWRIELDGDRYRAQRLTEPHPLESYGRTAALLRRDGQFDLATGYGGLLRTSDSSTTGWIVVRPNWPHPRVPKFASRTALVDLAGDLAAVGVYWQAHHYQLQPEGPPRMLGYYYEGQGQDGWLTLPPNQEVVSVVQEDGRAYLVSTFGEVHLVQPGRAPEVSWSPEQGRNLRFATAGAGRIWAAPHGGTYFPIYPNQGTACEPTAVAFGSLLLAQDGYLLHATGPNLSIAEVPPIVECGLPQE